MLLKIVESACNRCSIIVEHKGRRLAAIYVDEVFNDVTVQTKVFCHNDKAPALDEFNFQMHCCPDANADY